MSVYKDHNARTKIHCYVSCVCLYFETAADTDLQRSSQRHLQ